jgi:hypothetical protein
MTTLNGSGGIVKNAPAVEEYIVLAAKHSAEAQQPVSLIFDNPTC